MPQHRRVPFLSLEACACACVDVDVDVARALVPPTWCNTHHVSLDWDAARVYDRVKPASTVAFRTDRSARLRGEASAHEIERHGGVSRAHVILEGGRRACERLEGDMDPPWRRAKRSLYAKLVRPILSSLEKGADVRRVADSLAVGFCIGLFPVFGACVREEDRGEGNARRGRRG